MRAASVPPRPAIDKHAIDASFSPAFQPKFGGERQSLNSALYASIV
jgi:hypothetical protein